MTLGGCCKTKTLYSKPIIPNHRLEPIRVKCSVETYEDVINCLNNNHEGLIQSNKDKEAIRIILSE